MFGVLRGCFLIFLVVTVLAFVLGFLFIPDVGQGRKSKLFRDYPIEKEFVLKHPIA